MKYKYCSTAGCCRSRGWDILQMLISSAKTRVFLNVVSSNAVFYILPQNAAATRMPERAAWLLYWKNDAFNNIYKALNEVTNHSRASNQGNWHHLYNALQYWFIYSRLATATSNSPICDATKTHWGAVENRRFLQRFYSALIEFYHCKSESWRCIFFVHIICWWNKYLNT